MRLSIFSKSGRIGRSGIVMAVIMLFTLSGCEKGGALPLESVDSRVVTAEVAAQLTSRGTFPRAAVTPQDFPQLAYSDAEGFADAFIQTFGVISETYWSHDHGSPVDGRALRRCGQTQYATTAYDLAQTLPYPPLQNFLAGQFITMYCGESGQPQVLVSVSEAATGLRIVAGGRLEMPTDGRGAHAITAHGLSPLTHATRGLLTAERAVELASEATGMRIASVPVLRRGAFPSSVAASVRHMRLETPVRAADTGSAGRSTTIDEVFVGLDPEFSNASTVLVRIGGGGAASDAIPVPGLDGAPTTIRVRRDAAVPGLTHRLLIAPEN